MTENKKQIRKIDDSKNSQQPKTNLVIPVSNSSHLDLSALPEDTRNAMIERFAEGTIDNVKYGQKLNVENKSMSEKMDHISTTVSKVSQSGASVTITSTHEDSMGHTEVMVGNTDAAASGKLSKAQRGKPDATTMYAIMGAVVVVLISIIASMRS